MKNNYPIPDSAVKFNTDSDFDYVIKSYLAREGEQEARNWEERQQEAFENYKSPKTPYDPRTPHLAVLGLGINATPEQIKSQFRKLVMENHPDKFSHLGNEKAIEEAEERFLRIKDAYDAIILESLPEANVDQE